ncbi:hypothetical protein [Arthrobacter sp. H14-L1]|uniref:hypothetical protein n=1 Tax=Arthrobacter sp. H14-L1 TaxID=2996697 RepID=UPI00226EC8CC|nr:hypothetical protein [Arthrobacter sp. H14-L1]MCY0906098.1 hypothetical protein [Arthrobacter sp. H14-L1]
MATPKIEQIQPNLVRKLSPSGHYEVSLPTQSRTVVVVNREDAMVLEAAENLRRALDSRHSKR